MKGDTYQNLIGILEQRLDMIVDRAKVAPTIFAARQIVNHCHVRGNGVKCNIPSRRSMVGEEITLRYEDTTDEEFFASLCGHSSH